jgi:hypothetical protein
MHRKAEAFEDLANLGFAKISECVGLTSFTDISCDGLQRRGVCDRRDYADPF